MSFNKKTWVNRQSEFPTRRTLSPVDGEENTYDVTRNEGTITTEGDAFNATNMNDLEDRINAAFSSISTDSNVIEATNYRESGTEGLGYFSVSKTYIDKIKTFANNRSNNNVPFMHSTAIIEGVTNHSLMPLNNWWKENNRDYATFSSTFLQALDASTIGVVYLSALIDLSNTYYINNGTFIYYYKQL